MSDVRPGQRATQELPEPSRAASGRLRGGEPRAPESTAESGGGAASAPVRPLYVTGLVAALWCVGIGLAVLTTITLIGWIAAPRTALGRGLPGVFRTVVNFWLVSHHAGFSSSHGRVGLLPLGVIVLPGALLYRGGAWMIRAARLPRRPRVQVVQVAVALAVPYAALAMLLALAAASPAVRPSAWQALVACFLVAVISGGLGAARTVVAVQVAREAHGRVRSGLGALLRLLPDRPRSLVIGVAGALAVLLTSGALLVGGSLALHTAEATRIYDMLAPGIVGGVLLLAVELAFLPNAVIWGMAYAVGPGFSVGAGTSVSPTGVFLDVVPAFPPLAALPEPGPAPAVSLLALAAPFVAGAVGGALTIRAMPSPVYEAAPLWGFLSGALTGAVTALLSALSGGPLGGGRLATVGPSAWRVGLMAALEVGVSAALAAWIANWLMLRRPAEETDAPPSRLRRALSRTPGAGPRPRRSRFKTPAAGQPRSRRRGTTTEPALPLAAPIAEPEAPAPAPAPKPEPAPKSPPYASDPLEFEEAEPVLAPRRPTRVRSHAEETEPAPPPASAPEEPGPEPDAADARPVPSPREDPGRTENRGGAIYVLREEPRQE